MDNETEEQRRDRQMSKGWIGVDLDGTLATYNGWQGETHIGEPIPRMVERVKKWLEEGRDVRIFTARISDTRSLAKTAEVIYDWCRKHLGQPLPITCMKDMKMIELWDDRCIQVVPNTGIRADGRRG
jgi:hypothetical protein